MQCLELGHGVCEDRLGWIDTHTISVLKDLMLDTTEKEAVSLDKWKGMEL